MDHLGFSSRANPNTACLTCYGLACMHGQIIYKTMHVSICPSIYIYTRIHIEVTYMIEIHIPQHVHTLTWLWAVASRDFDHSDYFDHSSTPQPLHKTCARPNESQWCCDTWGSPLSLRTSKIRGESSQHLLRTSRVWVNGKKASSPRKVGVPTSVVYVYVQTRLKHRHAWSIDTLEA